MGFRAGATCTVWDVRPSSDVCTDVRISISKKDRQTDEFVQEFGGYVRFCGSDAARKALGLKPRDRVVLGDVDVTNRYNKQTDTTYTNFAVFSFEMAGNNSYNNSGDQNGGYNQSGNSYGNRSGGYQNGGYQNGGNNCGGYQGNGGYQSSGYNRSQNQNGGSRRQPPDEREVDDNDPDLPF